MKKAESKLNKYCVYIEKINCEKVIVYAESSDKAVKKVLDACENGKIDFSEPIDIRYECEIDCDSVRDDETNVFDDENYSDINTQILK